MIFSRENQRVTSVVIFLIFSIFSIFSKYQPLLLLLFTYYSNSCVSNTNCSSP